MPCFEPDSRSSFQKTLSNILKAGAIPKHLGVIMDGNRRFAKTRGVSMIDAYIAGRDKLDELIRWAYELGIQEVTAYTFSIDNFKRSEGEKEIVFRTLKNKFENDILMGDMEIDEKEKIPFAIHVIGDWSRLPVDLREVMAEVMIRSKHYTNFVLNLAVAYTSRNEIANGAECLRQGILGGDLKIDDISQDLFTDVLQVYPTHPVDLLIRTSQTYRLSDFLLWQSSEGILHFIEHEWPELTFWDLWSGIFKFQRNQHKLVQLKQKIKDSFLHDEDSKERQKNFLDKLRERRWSEIENETNN